ncbi:MAG: Flp family type IVb pilin [Acidobacteriota bacterium]
MKREFLRDQTGQDLIEYTLLLAFICLVSAAAYIGMGTSIGRIWSIVNSRMADAASSGS